MCTPILFFKVKELRPPGTVKKKRDRVYDFEEEDSNGKGSF
jgi:hypothetical protein